MENEKKTVWKNRDAKVDRFLWGALDRDMSSGGFTEACLTHVIRRASQSADRLSKRVAWLNIILIVLGALGLLVATYSVFRT